MNTRGLRKIVSSFVLSAFVFPACFLAQRAPVEETAPIIEDVHNEGNLPKAVDLLDEADLEKPDDKPLTSEYISTVEALKQSADRAFDQGDFTRSGKIYATLLKNFANFEPFASELSFTRNMIEAKLKNCRIGDADLKFKQNLQRGDFENALDSYLNLVRYYPDDSALSSTLTKASHDIKGVGDKALQEENHPLAGKIHSLLLRNYESLGKFLPKVDFSREDLEKLIDISRSALTKNGLAEYRKGNLVKTIAIWESLLEFDPENAEIKKAIETAKSQARKLKKKIP